MLVLVLLLLLLLALVVMHLLPRRGSGRLCPWHMPCENNFENNGVLRPPPWAAVRSGEPSAWLVHQ